MSEIIFKPWVGPKYASADNHFDRRLLVLGESHYGPVGAECPDTTIEVVQRYTQGGARLAFFTKIAKVLLGLDGTTWLSNALLMETFQNIAFYNYIPMFVGDYARQRPTSEMWEAGRTPFIKVLDQLQPQLVIILGKTLNHHVPELPGNTQRCFIQHPSTGFSYTEWGPRVTQAIQQLPATSLNNTNEQKLYSPALHRN